MTIQANAAVDLDDELGIPSTAVLSLPPSFSSPVMLAISSVSDDSASKLSDLITIATDPSDADRIENSDKCQVFLPICLQSSMRKNAPSDSSKMCMPRSLVVGRQASAADIRVDHKSVSRRHTAFYYIQPGQISDEPLLVIHDLGGKHGTFVNCKRLDKYGATEIRLQSFPDLSHTPTEHVVQFGNAPVICRIILPQTEHNQQLSDQKNVHQSQSSNECHDLTHITVTANNNSKTPIDNSSENSTSKKADLDLGNQDASTRASREAQIAAMIASLDEDPIYSRYVPSEKENHIDAITETKDILDNDLDKKISLNFSETNKFNLPITSSITLSPGSDTFSSTDGSNTPLQSNSSVSTICFEPSGSRLVAGHRDGTLRFYDFHGMKPSSSAKTSQIYYPPFRVVDLDNDPLDSTGRHVLTCLNPSPSGAQWIVGTTSSQPKVIDREGHATLFHFIKGDTYVTDASNTKGHTAGVTGVAFHPLVKDISWSCGLDGSIRQWNLSGRGKTQFGKLICQKVVAKCKNEKGQRTQIVSTLGVHPSGRKVVVGTSCGSIQVWNCFGSGVTSRPLGVVYSAHGGAKPVTFVTFSADGERIASRSESDDTVRVWDVNRMEKESYSTSRKYGGNRKEDSELPSPSFLVAICKGLPALNEAANCTFSPDEELICAGTSIDITEKTLNSCGKLKFYQLPGQENPSKSTDSISGSLSSTSKRTIQYLDPIVELDVAPGASVLAVVWHPKLNQIAFGTSNGIVQVLFDSQLSIKGAVTPTSRSVSLVDGLSDLLRSRAPTGSAAYLKSTTQSDSIILPNALPLFRDEPRATRKTKDRDRKDPAKTKLPEPPIKGGIKTGAQVGSGINFTQFIVESSNYVNNKNIAGKDPREELFKYSEGKSYVSKAYEGDVQKILAEKTVEEEEEEMKHMKKMKTK